MEHKLPDIHLELIGEIVDSVHRRLFDERKAQLKNMVFIDHDNIPVSYIFDKKDNIRDNIFYVVIFRKGTQLSILNKYNLVDRSFISTKTQDKEASDQVISLLAGILHSFLPIKNVDYIFVSKDHFITTLCSGVNQQGRKCHTHSNRDQLISFRERERERERNRTLQDHVHLSNESVLLEEWKKYWHDSVKNFATTFDLNFFSFKGWIDGKRAIDEKIRAAFFVFLDGFSRIARNLFVKRLTYSMLSFSNKYDLDYVRLRDFLSDRGYYAEGLSAINNYLYNNDVLIDESPSLLEVGDRVDFSLFKGLYAVHDIRGVTNYIENSLIRYHVVIGNFNINYNKIRGKIVDTFFKGMPEANNLTNGANVIFTMGYIYGLFMKIRRRPYFHTIYIYEEIRSEFADLNITLEVDRDTFVKPKIIDAPIYQEISKKPILHPLNRDYSEKELENLRKFFLKESSLSTNSFAKLYNINPSNVKKWIEKRGSS